VQSNNFYQLQSGYVRYNASDDSYSVLGTTFLSINRVSGTAGGTLVYAKPDTTGTEATVRFDLVQPNPGTYSRTASVLAQGQARGSYCVLGVPTLSTDIPSATTVAFSTYSVRGRAFDKRSGRLVEYDLAPSTGTLIVNLSTGQFTSRLTLVGAAGATNLALGTYDIEGSLREATSGLSGGPAGGPKPAPTPGTVGGITVQSIHADGGFFGPKGVEFAYVFSRSESTGPNPADVSFSFFGTLAGSR
jgi:hypothetical protein